MKESNFFIEKRLVFKDGPEGGFFDKLAKLGVAAKGASFKEVQDRGDKANERLAEVESKALQALAQKTGTQLEVKHGINTFNKDGKHVFSVFKYPDGTFIFVKVASKGNGYSETALRNTRSASLIDLVSKHLDSVFLDEKKDLETANKLAQESGTTCEVKRQPAVNNYPEMVDYNFIKDGKVRFHISCNLGSSEYYLVEHNYGGARRGESVVGKPANSMKQVIENNFNDYRKIAQAG